MDELFLEGELHVDFSDAEDVVQPGTRWSIGQEPRPVVVSLGTDENQPNKVGFFIETMPTSLGCLCLWIDKEDILEMCQALFDTQLGFDSCPT